MGRGAGKTILRDYVGRMMLYEELHSKVINFYGYPVALLEEPVVMDAVRELVPLAYRIALHGDSVKMAHIWHTCS